jgi:carboxyl-terminal processing protease
MFKVAVYLLILIFSITACTPKYHTSKLANLIYFIKNDYVEELNTTQITDVAIQQILLNLDPHSVYLSRRHLENFLTLTIGEFGGIGISMGIQNSLLTVITPLPNTPAQKAGIKAGDIILKINNHSTQGLSLEKAVMLTKGKIGTKLSLTILRKSQKTPLLFKIKRANIIIDPIITKKINSDLLYVKISSFNKHIFQEFKEIMLKHKNIKGLILDLRSNPGGILEQAVAIVDMFIDKGIIVTQKGRNPQYSMQYQATKEMINKNTSMVILINEGSASASEIVSGALQVHKRAKIIGEKSFGKGSVQTLFPLDNNSALKLTIAKYYLPNGKSIHNIGIKPDIIVRNRHSIKHKPTKISKKKIEHILKKINNGSLKPIYVKKQSISNTKIFTQREMMQDNQLRRAIKELKNSNTN